MITLLQRNQMFTFCIVWTTYCITYFLRKPIGKSNNMDCDN